MLLIVCIEVLVRLLILGKCFEDKKKTIYHLKDISHISMQFEDVMLLIQENGIAF